MMSGIKNEVEYIVTDFLKYMDTTVPLGVNRKLFTHLKYSNKARMKRFIQKYNMPREVIEKKAIDEFLRQDDETILQKCDVYMED